MSDKPNDGGLGEIPIAKTAEELGLKPKAQAQIDAETTLVRLQLEKLRLEKEKLELEKLTNDVMEIRRKQESQRVSRETVQESLNFAIEKRVDDETNCTHMK